MDKERSFVEPIRDLDAEAARFLTAYGFEEHVTTPLLVPIEEIAEKMGLTIVDHYLLGSEERINGFTTLASGQTTVYNSDKTPVECSFEEGSIFIDASLPAGVRRNTIAHECFHWYKHYDFLRNLKNIRRTEYKPGQEKKKSAEYWAEWQARKMAPRILMPKAAAANLMHRYLETHPDAFENFKIFLDFFADCFSVSKKSACIRLMELDCPPAGEYYHRVFYRAEDSLPDGIYHLSENEAMELYLTNNAFYKLLSSDKYVYTAEGFVALNDPKYIKREKGSCSLTDKAWENLNKCLLPVEDYLFSVAEITDRKLCYSAPKASIYRKYQGNESTKTEDKLNHTWAGLKKMVSRQQESYVNVGFIIWEYMQEQDIDKKSFLDLTNLSERVYKDIEEAYKEAEKKRKDPAYKPENHTFSFESLVSIMYVLGLRQMERNEIFDLTNYALRENNLQHRGYLFCIDHCQNKGINACDEMLQEAGLLPFSGKIR